MNTTNAAPSVAAREIVFSCLIPAPREEVYRAWTDPDLLKQWFAPKPFTTSAAQLDVRAGGSSLIVMRDPNGVEMPNAGVYLEVVKNERLVFTNAYSKAWDPSDKPFVTFIITFENEGGGTRYTARARHWSVADKEMHEAMQFQAGWRQCADQLTALLLNQRQGGQQ